MTFAIAAAGTGGHVFPGLAVGEALLARGVNPGDVIYIGGSRLESSVYPEAGFPFFELELRGLRRSISLSNLAIPRVVMAARRRILEMMGSRGTRAALGLGGYVTVPMAMAAAKAGVPYAVAEQNAEAGLANRFAAGRASKVFGSFPETARLPKAEWVGNPLRRPFAEFDRGRLRPQALDRYRLEPRLPVLGVFGGSLGASVINEAVATMLDGWTHRETQVVQIAGREGAAEMAARSATSPLRWTVLDFEDRMDLFFAAADLVVARSGGSVAEITATATPAILVPGHFGSGSHQEANARALEQAGAAVVVTEDELVDLGMSVASILADEERRTAMSRAAGGWAKPHAADSVVDALMAMAGLS